MNKTTETQPKSPARPLDSHIKWLKECGMMGAAEQCEDLINEHDALKAVAEAADEFYCASSRFCSLKDKANRQDITYDEGMEFLWLAKLSENLNTLAAIRKVGA